MADAALVAALVVTIAMLLVIGAFLRWMFSPKGRPKADPAETGLDPETGDRP